MPRRNKQLNELIQASGRRCHYCNDVVNTRDPRSGKYATRDHALPRSRGGTLSKRNIVLACRACNNEKGDMDQYEFARYKRLLRMGDDRDTARKRAVNFGGI